MFIVANNDTGEKYQAFVLAGINSLDVNSLRYRLAKRIDKLSSKFSGTNFSKILIKMTILLQENAFENTSLFVETFMF